MLVSMVHIAVIMEIKTNFNYLDSETYPTLR